ncbi:hypothetical protein ACQ5SP_02440 [Rhodovulum sp. YNF3179]|uniref:hypothetical protein n=1 Tax=Rhodovulum sp. YNF3179 TaxID=3425127 RepID=UPI003D32F359
MPNFEGAQADEIARRMIDVAEGYLADADQLSSIGCYSENGVSMLGIIGFEIYLKAAVLLETEFRPPSHDYWKIWNMLSEDSRDKIYNEAKCRLAVEPALDDLKKLFDDLRNAFEKGRYSYEINDDRNADAAASAGRKWIAAGGNLADADLRFHPEARVGLVHALREFCNDMRSPSHDATENA